jgi:DNA-directed RNA polymerase subunit RPC12/RpoP
MTSAGFDFGTLRATRHPDGRGRIRTYVDGTHTRLVYECARCGQERQFRDGRPVPILCHDCKFSLSPAERAHWIAVKAKAETPAQVADLTLGEALHDLADTVAQALESVEMLASAIDRAEMAEAAS